MCPETWSQSRGNCHSSSGAVSRYRWCWRAWHRSATTSTTSTTTYNKLSLGGQTERSIRAVKSMWKILLGALQLCIALIVLPCHAMCNKKTPNKSIHRMRWRTKEEREILRRTNYQRVITWESDLCHGCPDGLGWLLQDPLLLLVRELIEHIELFLDPRDSDGLDGGVANDHWVTSQPFMSVITCSDAGGKWCGDAACLCNWSDTSCKCVNSINIAISSS